MGAATNVNELLQRRLKRVRYQVPSQASGSDGSFYMLIDLSNASGKWKHGTPKAGQGVRIYGAHVAVGSATAADIYRIDLGVVLRVDATNADLAMMQFGAYANELYFPNYHDFTVDTTNNVLLNAFATKTLTSNTGVQNDVDLVDPQGNNVLPAVGDIVFRIISTKGSPAGAAIMADVDVWYDVV